jgi:hypothetical protein
LRGVIGCTHVPLGCFALQDADLHSDVLNSGPFFACATVTVSASINSAIRIGVTVRSNG